MTRKKNNINEVKKQAVPGKKMENSPEEQIPVGSADAFDETENPRSEVDRELSDEQFDEEISDQ
jgi:hypothetical protein